MTLEADVVVVGAGIAGLSAAWALAEGASVVVLEQEAQPAHHASGRSAAILSETSGPAVVCELAARSRPFLADPPALFSAVALLRPRGLLWVDDRADALAAVAAQATTLGVGHEVLSSDQAQGLVGVLRRSWLAGAVLEPDAMTIDVAALLDGFRSGLLARGGRLLTSQPVTAVNKTEDGWHVGFDGGDVRCDVVVNAAGAWVDRVAGLAGLSPLGFRPLLRTAFTFPIDNDASDWPLVMDLGGRYYFEPEGDGLLASPADETLCEPHDARADELAMARATDALGEATTLHVRGVRSKWAGLRTFAPDRLPVVGFDPRASGFFWLAGQGGGGVKTSPAMASLTRDLILGSAADRFATIGPERLIH